MDTHEGVIRQNHPQVKVARAQTSGLERAFLQTSTALNRYFARKSSHEVESKDNAHQNSKDAGILRGVWRELQERQEVKPEPGTSNCTEHNPLVVVIINVQGVQKSLSV